MLSFLKKIDNPVYTFFTLFLLTCLSYYSILDHTFVLWDDQYYVRDNPFVNNPTWNNFKVLLTKIISLNYHPLTMISLWLNAFISGTSSATPFIITNVFIHFINSFLIYLLVLNLTKENFIAWLTAIIFVIHPMHVESVAWVSERKDVLYMCFFLLSSLAFLKYRSHHSIKYYTLSLFLFICACLSKAMAVSLVPVLLIMDNFKAADRSIFYIDSKSLKPLIPFIITALLFGLLAIDVQSGGNGFGLLSRSETSIALDSNEPFGFYEKIAHASYALYFYIGKFLVPNQLCAFHPYGYVLSLPLLKFYPLALLACTLGYLYFFRRNKLMIFAILFFFATLVHVLQFIKVGSAIVAERYTYLPYVGLAMILAYALQKIKAQSSMASYSIVSILIAAFVYLTQQQVDTWRDHTTLFEKVINIYPTSGQAHHIYATGLWENGQIEQAITHTTLAIDQLNYVKSDAFDLLGNCHAAKGEINKALAYFGKAIELDTSNYFSRYHRAVFIVEHFADLPQSALKIALDDLTLVEASNIAILKPLLYGPRGKINGLLKHYDQAIDDFTKAIEFQVDLKYNLFDRGVTFELIGDYEKALADFEKSLELDPNMLAAQQKRAQLINK